MTLQYLKYVLELRCSPGEYSAELKPSQRHMYKKLCGNNAPHVVNWLVFVAASQALEQTLAGIDELELLKENNISCKFISFLLFAIGNQNLSASPVPHVVIRRL